MGAGGGDPDATEGVKPTMLFDKTRNASQQYDRIGVQSEVEYANPHRLVQMLMEGAAARIARAQAYLQRGAVAEKGQSISLAISIIEGLQSSLDMEKGGQIAENLDRLYEYMTRRLLEANLKNDKAILEEVQDLLQQLREGWDAMAKKTVEKEAQRADHEFSTTIQVTG